MGFDRPDTILLWPGPSKSRKRESTFKLSIEYERAQSICLVVGVRRVKKKEEKRALESWSSILHSDMHTASNYGAVVHYRNGWWSGNGAGSYWTSLLPALFSGFFLSLLSPHPTLFPSFTPSTRFLLCKNNNNNSDLTWNSILSIVLVALRRCRYLSVDRRPPTFLTLSPAV